MPAQFENGTKIDSKNSFLDFDAEEKYLHTKNRPVSIRSAGKGGQGGGAVAPPMFSRTTFLILLIPA